MKVKKLNLKREGIKRHLYQQVLIGPDQICMKTSKDQSVCKEVSDWL